MISISKKNCINFYVCMKNKTKQNKNLQLECTLQKVLSILTQIGRNIRCGITPNLFGKEQLVDCKQTNNRQIFSLPGR